LRYVEHQIGEDNAAEVPVADVESRCRRWIWEHLPKAGVTSCLLIGVYLSSIGCYRSPQEGFSNFLSQFDTFNDQVLVEATTSDCEVEGDMDITGSWALVFITTMKTEPSRDVLLLLTQCGDIGNGTAIVTGRAVSFELPDLELGVIPEASVDDDGSFALIIEDFQIPPGQEELLPDGGIAELELTATIHGEDLFCGSMVFRLLSPITLDQDGAFGAYRQGATEPGEAGCPE